MRVAKEMPQLEKLATGEKTTDEDVSDLDEKLANLRELRVHGLGIPGQCVTDAGAKHIARNTKLTKLSLGGSKITDAGLQELGKLDRLKSLEIIGTGVTDAGVAEFKKNHPNVDVVR